MRCRIILADAAARIILVRCAVELRSTTCPSCHTLHALPGELGSGKSSASPASAVFGTRFFVQWLHSEKHKESRIPTIPSGGKASSARSCCLAYFLRQQDSVGVVGNTSSI